MNSKPCTNNNSLPVNSNSHHNLNKSNKTPPTYNNKPTLCKPDNSTSPSRGPKAPQRYTHDPTTSPNIPCKASTSPSSSPSPSPTSCCSPTTTNAQRADTCPTIHECYVPGTTSAIPGHGRSDKKSGLLAIDSPTDKAGPIGETYFLGEQVVRERNVGEQRNAFNGCCESMRCGNGNDGIHVTSANQMEDSEIDLQSTDLALQPQEEQAQRKHRSK